MFRFIERLRIFFYGRNGVDSLGKFSLVIYFVVAIINAFVRNWVARGSLLVVQWLILIFIIFRVLSKNLPARRNENRKFEVWFLKFKPHLDLLGERIRNFKTKRYRTCPNCKAVSRLPIRRGRHFVKCPKCNIPFRVFILF